MSYNVDHMAWQQRVVQEDRRQNEYVNCCLFIFRMKLLNNRTIAYPSTYDMSNNHSYLSLQQQEKR